MPAEAVQYSLMPSTQGTAGLIGGMVVAAIVGFWEAGKMILRTKRARKMLAAGLDVSAGSGENSDGKDMSGTLLEILRRMEADRQEEARQRDRQWEIIGQCVKECRDHSANLLTVVNTIQNMAVYMDNTHKHQSEAIKSVADNVINLSGYLYRRLGDGAGGWSRPPMQAGGL